MRYSIVTLLLVCAVAACAQTSNAPAPFVQAVGQGVVAVQPDEVKIDFSVVTTAASAQHAASQNAAQTTALIAALQGLLGSKGNVQTIGYSLNPNYNYPPNGTPVLIGFTASNTVEISATDLSMAGTIIDTGVQAGANTVQSLQFTLQNPAPAQQQALKAATAEAKSNADAMASGVGMHSGAVLSIEENVSTSVTPVSVAPAANTTPVLPGLVNIQATVTLMVALTN